MADSAYRGRSDAIKVRGISTVGYSSVGEGAAAPAYEVTVTPSQVGLIWFMIDLGYCGGQMPYFVNVEVGGPNPLVNYSYSYDGVGMGWLTGEGTYRVVADWHTRVISVAVMDLGAVAVGIGG